jgi:hypothetical protein
MSSIHLSFRSFISFIHSAFHSFMHSAIHSCIHSFMHSFIHPAIHSSIQPFIYSAILSFIHSLGHSFIHLPIHSSLSPSQRPDVMTIGSNPFLDVPDPSKAQVTGFDSICIMVDSMGTWQGVAMDLLKYRYPLRPAEPCPFCPAGAHPCRGWYGRAWLAPSDTLGSP